jgi:hypothetical protein
MKLLPPGPQPIALLPSACPCSSTMTKEEIRAWWEERFAELDLKKLIREAWPHLFEVEVLKR